MKCSLCATENRVGARFCENCGGPLARACPNCGEPLSPQAKFCGNCGASTAAAVSPSTVSRFDEPVPAPSPLVYRFRQAGPSLEGERKPVTILFTDVVGSTALAEGLDPEEWKDIVAGAHDQVAQAVNRYGGAIAQFLGDGVLAFFGAPSAHEEDPVCAVRAALYIQKRMEEYRQLLAPRVENFQMRIGLNTGLVVVGPLGTSSHMEYLALGDAVNLAARVMAGAAPGSVSISEETYRQVAHAFEMCDRGWIQVKGKSEPVHVYEPVREKAGALSARSPVDLESPMLGRESELGQLLQLGAAAEAGVGRVAIIVGEPGIGKSRLISEWRAQQKASNPRLRWVEASCIGYGQGLPYGLVADLVRSLLGVIPSSGSQDARAALLAHTQEAWGAEFAEPFAYLAHFLSLPLDSRSESYVRTLNSRGLQTQYRAVLERLFLGQAAQTPLVILCEDIHWADASSVELLTKLLPLAQRAPILFLLTSRPDRDTPGWQLVEAARMAIGAGLTLIDLQPLPSESARQLTTILLGLDVLPASIQELVLAKAEGNPLFIQEIAHTFLDKGAVSESDGKRTFTGDPTALDIPDNIRRLILSRVDRLPDEPRLALRVASVIGREFLLKILEQVLEQIGHPTAHPELMTELGALEFSSFVRLFATHPEIAYLFSHALVQEATYEAILKADRRTLHSAVGEALERAFPNRTEELAATLAYHFQRGGVRDKAIAYFIRAADRARDQFANAEAISQYKDALGDLNEALRAGDAGRSYRKELERVAENLGVVLALTGKHEEARAMYSNALSCVQADPIAAARLYRFIGNTWLIPRLPANALESFARAEHALGEMPTGHATAWRREWMDLQLARIWAYYWSADARAMAECCERVRPMVEEFGEPLHRAQFYRSLTLAAFRRDCYAPSNETLEDARRSYEAAVASSAASETAFSRFVFAFAHFWRGDLDIAEKELQETLALAQKIGDAERTVLCLTYLTVLYRRRMDSDRVREYSARSMEAATEAKIPFYIHLASVNRAWTDWQSGVPVDFEKDTAVPLVQSEKAQFPAEWLMRAPLLALALEHGQDEVAIEQAVKMCGPTQRRFPEPLEQLYTSAIQAWEGGNREQAHGILDGAVKLAKETGYL